MTALGMVFERHREEFPVVSGGFQPVPIGPRRQPPPIRATTSPEPQAALTP